MILGLDKVRHRQGVLRETGGRLRNRNPCREVHQRLPEHERALLKDPLPSPANSKRH